MSLGFDLGYDMEFDEQGLGEPERKGKARQEYEYTVSRLHGAALEAFEEEVVRGRERAKSDLWAESLSVLRSQGLLPFQRGIEVEDQFRCPNLQGSLES